MARRPTPIVIQSPERETTGQGLAGLGQFLGVIGQLRQQAKQRQQRGQLEQSAVQEGISPETAKLANTEALAKFLIGKKTREASVTRIAEAAQTLSGTRSEVTTRPPEAPPEVQVPQVPSEALTQPIELGREAVTDVTQVPRLPADLAKAAATLRVSGAIEPTAFTALTGLVGKEAKVPKLSQPILDDLQARGIDITVDVEPEEVLTSIRNAQERKAQLAREQGLEAEELRIRRGLTSETAGKLALLSQASSDVDETIELLFPQGREGGLSRKAQIGGFFNLPIAKGRQISSRIQNAVAAKLRAETGAAANADEVKNIAKRFQPVPGLDDAASTLDKLDRLKEFLNQGAFFIDPTGKLRNRFIEKQTTPIKGKTKFTIKEIK